MSSRTEALSPRARNVRRAIRRHGLSRGLAYAAALAGCALFLFYLAELGAFDRAAPAPGINAGSVKNPDLVRGTNATISGTDAGNQPFEVTAAVGLQDRDEETLVHLKTVNGMFQRPDGNPLTVTSAKARYDTDSKLLELQGQVVFDEAQRFRATMDGAIVNTDTQTLQSKSPVRVEVIGGTITADSFTVSERGSRMLFKGGVKARFVTQDRPSGDRP